MAFEPYDLGPGIRRDERDGLPMPEMTGVVTLVQEGRFQLTDEAGVSHHFVLSSHALVETEQLPPLARDQTRIRVKYKPAKGIIAYTAERIELPD